MRMRKWLGLAAAFLFLAGCTWGGPSGPSGKTKASLRAVAGCADLESVLRKAAIEQMADRVKQELDFALQYGGCMWRYGEEDANGAGGIVPGAITKSTTGGASEYSTTNDQEKGVDEADFVKNDNKYIYLVGGTDTSGFGTFTILQAWPAPLTGVLSSFPIEGVPKQMFVFADQAVVYSQLPLPAGSNPYQDCYGGYGWYDDCYAQAQGSLKITILDISDKSNPVLTREIRLSGSYVNSRRIEEAVHTVVTFPGVHFDGLKYWPEELNTCATFSTIEIYLAFAHLMTENERIINETPFENWLPTISDHRVLPDGSDVTDTSLMADCKNFYEPELASGRGFLGLLSFALTGDDSLAMASIVGESGEVYASQTNLYVATILSAGAGPWFYENSSSITEASTIHKFSLSHSPARATYQASGVVEGRVLNQFSMGENNDAFRIATTTGHRPDPNAHNSVFVLEQHGEALDTVGSLTNVAPGEDIRSARFLGDRGFVVTFKKTDPLFTIDLTDPYNPVLVGQLQIPGFSTYLHPMDDTHLLTIGFDADDHGSFAWFMGIQLQIFDVADLANPTLVQKYLIGTRGTSSEATADHFAFNYFAPKNLLALPMALCDDGGVNGMYASKVDFDGLMVFHVTVADGFSEWGRVPHRDPGASCYNWWQDPNSGVKRSIVMDDFVFSISDTLLKVNTLDDLATDVVSLPIPQIPR